MDSNKKITNVLFITNMYPYADHIYLGIHVKEQVDYLTENFPINSSIIFINAIKKGKPEYIKSIFRIIRTIKRHNLDVIHIHYGLSALFLLFFRPKVKFFLTFHGGDILKEQGNYIQVFISKLIAKKVDKIFVLNKEMEEIAKKLHVPYELLPCGVNSDFFVNQKQTSTSNHSKLILFPGDPSRKVKNFGLFLQVIDILKKQHNYQIDYICIHNKSRTEVRDLLNKADCLLMTSFSEGSPQTIKEALSCNLPVVSVPVGDVSNMLNNIPSCFASEDNDPVTLSNLVVLTMKERNENIRKEFLKKETYDNKAVCRRIYENYISFRNT